jgi:hypothetical protein
MKYLSVLAFLLLLAWTWNVIHTDQAISFETHAGIQEKLAQVIQQTILNKKPNASGVRIQRLWTEPEGNDKVLANFVYTFQEPDSNGKTVTSQITGHGLLEKQTDDGSGMDRWSLKEVKTTGDSIVFEDGLMVTPGEEPAAESAVSMPSPTPAEKTDE